VREEIERIMGFWLELGVSGFRVDAAPFMIENKTKRVLPAGPRQYEYLVEFRRFLSWRRGYGMMLAEANVLPEEVPNFFGNGDRIHMLFNFWVNQRLFLAAADEDARPPLSGSTGLKVQRDSSRCLGTTTVRRCNTQPPRSTSTVMTTAGFASAAAAQKPESKKRVPPMTVAESTPDPVITTDIPARMVAVALADRYRPGHHVDPGWPGSDHRRRNWRRARRAGHPARE
jgi:hypothetical protein